MLYQPFNVGHMNVTCTIDNADKHQQCVSALKTVLSNRDMLKEDMKKGSSLLEEWLEQDGDTETKAGLLDKVSEEKLDAAKRVSVQIKVNKQTHDGLSVEKAIEFMKKRP